MSMKQATMVAALVLGGFGCNRGGAGGGGQATPFDKRWQSLADQGAQAIRVVDDKGAALMDNVLGAQSGAIAMAPLMAESLKGGGQKGPLPERPDPNEVQKLVRQYVPGVKSCYQRMTREGDTRTGKAIVSFQIAGNGHVEQLNVDAPQFDGSELAKCIDLQVSRWVFPASRSGTTAMSYPFVFVGG